MANIFFSPAFFKRSIAPIHKLISGINGFFTKIGMLVPLAALAISCTANGLPVVRAPIQTKSILFSNTFSK